MAKMSKNSLKNLELSQNKKIQISFQIDVHTHKRLLEVLDKSVHVKPHSSLGMGMKFIIQEFIFQHKSLESSLFYKWQNDDYYRTTLKFGDQVN